MNPTAVAPGIAVALDVPDARAARVLVDSLGSRLEWVKVGLELFIAEGPALVGELVDRDLSVFLDLKLHDIPNTVSKAVMSAGALGVDLLTVHATGGPTMIRAAREAAESVPGHRPAVVAVTVLTSLGGRELSGIWGRTGGEVDVADEVERIAREAADAGADGMVCSPLEAARLRSALGLDALLVTPGVRLPTDDVGDQVRIATPEQAAQDGASLLVVGRPIREAADPAAALERFQAAARAGVEAP